MDYFHKDDNISGTQRPSKLLFYVNIYLQYIQQYFLQLT